MPPNVTALPATAAVRVGAAAVGTNHSGVNRVVSRDIKSVLYDNRGQFGAHNAGISPYGGSALPLYDIAADKAAAEADTTARTDQTKPVAFQMDYRFTMSL